MPLIKKLTPPEWRSLPYFEKLTKLRGVPVMNLHLWFDRKRSTVDNLIFSRSKLLSVFADMSETCRGYSSNDHSMLELLFAPAAKYMQSSDEEILQVTLEELERLFRSPRDCCRRFSGQSDKVHVREDTH